MRKGLPAKHLANRDKRASMKDKVIGFIVTFSAIGISFLMGSSTHNSPLVRYEISENLKDTPVAFQSDAEVSTITFFAESIEAEPFPAPAPTPVITPIPFRVGIPSESETEECVQPGLDVIEQKLNPEASKETNLQKELPELLLQSVPLGAEVQTAIYNLCDCDNELFCAVMAIAQVESGFNPYATANNSDCIGIMQINLKYHIDRMNRLGVTDLTDPIQCATIAIDYIRELSWAFGWVNSHNLYLAYSAGPGGAAKLNEAGVYSSRYTHEVMRYYERFLKELYSEENEEAET